MSSTRLPRALWREGLPHDFHRARLGLKLLGAPISHETRDLVAEASDIFQIDLRTTRSGDEYFRIWPGAHNNQIEVLDADPLRRQVILRVQEPRRRFVEAVGPRWFDQGSPQERLERSQARIVAKSAFGYRIERWTPHHDRRFLCGQDDVKLFIAPVDGASTIGEAHSLLKPQRVREAEARCPSSVARQGEWFFVPPTREEGESLAERLALDPHALRRERSVGRVPGPRPHVADEVILLWPGQRREARFARGRVRHVDHHDLVLPALRRVIPNTAFQERARPNPRVRWID